MKNGSASGYIANTGFSRTTRFLGCALSVMLALTVATPSYAKSEIRALREQVKELRAQNEQLQAVIDQASAKPEETKGKHSSKQQQKELNEGSKALEYNKKIRELEAFNKQLSGAVAELERQNKALQDSQTEQTKLMGQAQAENQKLKNETSEHEKLQQALQALMKENENLKNEAALAQQKYAEMEAQKNKANSEQLGQMQQSLADTQAENLKLKEGASNQEKMQLAVQSLLKENERLKKELGTEQQKYTELETQKNTANSELLGKQQQSLAELQAENRKLAQALADMTTKVVDLEKQQGEGQKGAQEAREMAAQLEDLNAKYAALQQENQALAGQSREAAPEKMQELIEQNKSLRETIRAQNDAIKVNDGASKSMTALQDENKKLRQALSSGVQKNPEDQETVKNLRLEIAALQNQLDEQSAQQAGIEELKQTVLALQQQNSILQKGQSSAGLENKGDPESSSGMAQILQAQVEKEKAVNTEYRQKIKEYQDQLARLQGQGENNDESEAQPTAVSSGVPAELAYDETVRALMIQNQELKARIELMELGAKTKTKHKKAPAEKADATSQGAQAEGQQEGSLKLTEGAALPQIRSFAPIKEEQVISATELLEVEPMTQNVQLIRKNHTALPEMPPAQNTAEATQTDPAENAAQAQYHIPKIEPAAGNGNSKEEAIEQKSKTRKNKSSSQTNG